MSMTIDVTMPEYGDPSTASVRANFIATQSQLDVLASRVTALEAGGGSGATLPGPASSPDPGPAPVWAYGISKTLVLGDGTLNAQDQGQGLFWWVDNTPLGFFYDGNSLYFSLFPPFADL